MGSQHCCCGNAGFDCRYGFEHDASMGPQHCCCGNALPLLLSIVTFPSFNGAAALLLRKFVEHCPCCPRSELLQWGRSIAAAEMRACACLRWRGQSFNGAAALLLRKWTDEISFITKSCCFNGAAALLLRKWPNFPRIRAREAWLQWGRSIAAAEISMVNDADNEGHPSFNGAAALLLRKLIYHDTHPAIAKPASMGPQHCCCGNCDLEKWCEWRSTSFNGAAALLLRKSIR